MSLSRKSILLSGLLGLLWAVPIASAEETVLITLKLLKSTPSVLPVQVKFPHECTACKSIDDPAYARQNAREIILAMRLPKSTPVDLHVQTTPSAIRRVTLESTDLPFSHTSTEISLTVPSQFADRINSGEFQTHLYWPGVELRFEHADLERRAGDYTRGDFPVVQRRAAAHLEFGLLDAIGKLGIDNYVDSQNLGRLWLMGFDTNDPHGHLDSPPHLHLAMWLLGYHGLGSTMPHIYISPQGLITHSLAGMVGGTDGSKPTDYTANQPFTATDKQNKAVFALTITPGGGLVLARPDGPRCELQPVASGFQSGVKVGCAGFSPDVIEVEDDLAKAEIRETVNGVLAATFHYDSDTGALLQP